jgi:hypothetical protein
MQDLKLPLTLELLLLKLLRSRPPARTLAAVFLSTANPMTKSQAR